MLYVDQRWVGKHGIGRFAAEVLAGISINYKELGAKGSASSPADLINPARTRLGQKDVLYSPGYNAGVSRALQVLTLHDLIHLNSQGPKAQFRRSYYELVIRPAVRRAGSLLTVSETSAKYIRQWLDDPAIEIVNVGNGCSDVFQELAEYQNERTDYFLFVGNLKKHKNFEVILEALKLRPNARLVAVINDRLNAEKVIVAHGLQNRVEILGDLTDEALADLYRGSSGVLLPSVLEGFGLPAVESLACGRPVAFFAGCESVAEIVGSYGVPVSSHDSSEEWATAMDELERLRGSFIAPPNAWREQFRWANVSSRVETHLASVMDRV